MVCVCVWNIWTDVKLLFVLLFSFGFFCLSFSHSFVSFHHVSRGTQHFTGTVSNEATSGMGYPVWPTGRTCFRYSNRLSWEPACRGLCLLLLFYLLSNRNNRSTFSTGPSLDSFFRTNRSIFLVMFINRRSLFGYRNMPLIFYSILRYSVRTEGHTGSVR